MERIFGKDLSVRVAFVGLAGAGKTTLVKRLKEEDEEISEEYLPTMGLNVETLKLHSRDTRETGPIEVIAADLGGQKTFPQSLWRPFVRKSEAVIFVFDGADPEKIEDAGEWLRKTISWTRKEACFMFLANKSDLEDAMPLDETIRLLKLKKTVAERPHTFGIYQISALTGDQVDEAWRWLTQRVVTQLSSKE